MLSNNLKRLRKEKGMTMEELAKRLGTSKQTIFKYENGIVANVPPEKVVLLAEALGTTPSELMGWVSREGMPITMKRVPLIGEIACGKPILACEEHDSFVVVEEGMDVDFCLRAHGDSMTGARIFDGDIVFIRSQDTVENGEIGAVIIDDEATLKRVYYYPEEGKLILSPENARYAPLVYVGEELSSIKIIGKAVAFQSRVI